MDRLGDIYTSFLKERPEGIDIFWNNTEKAEHLYDMLEAVTKAENFDNIEECLNEVLAEAEEDGFKNGVRFAFREFVEGLKA